MSPLKIGHYIENLKGQSPTLQRYYANILEHVTVFDPSIKTIISSDIESGLGAAFQHKVLSEIEDKQPEVYALELEEAGLAVSAASRVLTNLLDSDQFSRKVNSTHFANSLSRILKSKIPFSTRIGWLHVW